jgi:hypothetical protein
MRHLSDAVNEEDGVAKKDEYSVRGLALGAMGQEGTEDQVGEAMPVVARGLFDGEDGNDEPSDHEMEPEEDKASRDLNYGCFPALVLDEDRALGTVWDVSWCHQDVSSDLLKSVALVTRYNSRGIVRFVCLSTFPIILMIWYVLNSPVRPRESFPELLLLSWATLSDQIICTSRLDLGDHLGSCLASARLFCTPSSESGVSPSM